MNRSDAIRPDWHNPEWRPPMYPAKEELPVTPGSFADPTITDEEYRKLADETRGESLKLWPTLADYLKHIYDNELAESSLLRVFEPRKIVPPGGFYSPKCAAASLISTMNEVALKHVNHMTIAPTEITALLLSYQVLKYKMPIYYVSEDFVRAVAATELPGDLALSDLKWPMPAMILGFPTKFMQEYTGREIDYVFAADVPGGDHQPPAWGTNLPTIACPDKLVFQFHSYNGGMLESFVTSWLKRDRISDTTTKYTYTDYTRAEGDKVQDDAAVSGKIGILLLKLLMILSIRPALLEHGQVQRPAKVNKLTGHVERKELWSPNIIGFRYKSQRQEPVGTHASPRWHWRRGHITHQRTGSLKDPNFVPVASLPRIAEGERKGEVDWLQVSEETRDAFWRCHKRLWIEPTLINFDEHEETPAPAPAA